MKQLKSIKRKTSSTPVSDLYVAAVLDKSGSMATKKPDMIGGFNTFVDQLKADKEGETILTMTLFDTEVTTPVKNVPIDQVPHLNNGTYVPDGFTALYDAIVKTIGHIDAYLANSTKKMRVLLMIATDGQENASRETTELSIVKSLIEGKQKEGWAVVFLGENMNAWAAGTSLGVIGTNTRSIDTKGGKLPGFMFTFRDGGVCAAAYKRAPDVHVASANYFAPVDDQDSKEAKDKKPKGTVTLVDSK